MTTNEDFSLAKAVAQRDIAQYTKERLDKLILELQSKISIVTDDKSPPDQLVSNPSEPDNKEVTFSILHWQSLQGKKLGTYEVAIKPKKEDATWLYAQKILQENNATIDNRYHEPTYQYSYWLFGDVIYRKRLKEPDNVNQTKKEEA